MSLIEDLKWRYACKRMNGQKVPQEKIDVILDAINLAPTSLGLEAFKVFVVVKQSLKDEIYDKACQQMQIKECSHLLVFAAKTQISGRYLDDYFKLIEEKVNPGKDWCDKYRSRIEGAIKVHHNDLEAWLSHQTYIALGFACVAAAEQHVDSVPMEGFDSDILNNILNLPERGYNSTLLLPLGYRDEQNDWNMKRNKVRKDKDRLFEFIA